MADVTHVEIFDCTPEQFFDLVTDYESYSDFLSEVQSCKILSQEADKKIVEYHVSVIKSFKYINEHQETRPTEVRWKFIKGDIFKSMAGHWKLSDQGGKTRAEYYAEASFGLLVPKIMTQKALAVNLPAMMKAYHKRVAQLYKGEQ